MPRWLAAREAMDGREVDFRWTRPDGGQRWFRTRIGQTAIADNPQAVFGIVQDVTAEHEARAGAVSPAAAAGKHRGAGAWRDVPGPRSRPGLRQLSLRQSGGRGTAGTRPADAADAVSRPVRADPSRRRACFQRKRDRCRAVAGADAARCFGSVCLVVACVGAGWKPCLSARPMAARCGTVTCTISPRRGWPSRPCSVSTACWTRCVRRRRPSSRPRIERRSFEQLLEAFLSVTGSAYGFVGEVLLRRTWPARTPRMHAISDLRGTRPRRACTRHRRTAAWSFTTSILCLARSWLTGEVVIANDPRTTPARAGCRRVTRPCRVFWACRLPRAISIVAMVGLSNQRGGYSDADVDFLQPLLGTVRQLVLARRSFAGAPALARAAAAHRRPAGREVQRAAAHARQHGARGWCSWTPRATSASTTAGFWSCWICPSR